MTKEIYEAIEESKRFLVIGLLTCLITALLCVTCRAIYDHYKEKRLEKLPAKEYVIEDADYQIKVHLIKKGAN